MRVKIVSMWFLGAMCIQALCPTVAASQERKEVTVNFLYEACAVIGQTARGMIPHFDCHSYVYGVLDTYLAIRQSVPKADRACFPVSLPPWQALKEVEPLVDWKKQGSLSAGPVIIKALHKAYPCE
jgi:Rap1a immunity proteins